MTPERWQRIEDLFQSARVLPSAAERAAFLNGACADDTELRGEVEGLLIAEDRAGSFINTSAVKIAAGVIADERAAAMEGKTVSHYKILAPLGAGGMGEVYLGEDTRVGRQVALKVLPDYLVRDAERMRRFQQEARAVLALNHPNIVTVYEIGQERDTQFIASELVRGDTLRARMLHAPLSLNESLEIATQVAGALTEAHREGIIHRDIKPENIMLRPDGYVKVLDFGIAKLTDTPAFVPAAEGGPSVLGVETAPGVVMGTAHYMSPEQARGLPVDVRTDVWSLGVVLYEMIAGRPPFEGATPSDVIAAVLDKSPPPLARYAPDVPGEAQWIVNKGLRKDREERYQTIKEMLSDLRDLKQELDALVRLEHSLAADGTGQARTGATLFARQQTRTKGQPIETDVAGPMTSSAEYLIGEARRHKLAATSVLMVVLLLGGGLVFGLYRLVAKRAHRVPFETMNVSRLTTSGNAVAAAVSPDGKYAAYVSTGAAGESVWIRQTATASSVEIVPPVPVEYEGLTFSRDSDYLYCFRWDRRKPDTELLKVPTLGGLVQSLPVIPGSSISFSPDGKQFAFIELHTTVGKSALVTSAADGGSQRAVAVRRQPDFFVAFPGAPAWSPDGQTIACAVGTSDATGQYVQIIGINANDGKEARLSPKRWASVRELAWLADGSGLVITARERLSAPMQIWWLDNLSGQAARITNDLNDYSGISLTADSGSLVTVHSDEATQISVAPATDFGGVQKIGTEAGRMEELVWLPDGRIVYRSNATGDANLWVMNADGTNKRQLTTGAGALFGLSASPDGKYLVFSSDRAGHFNLWRFDVATAELKQLTDGDGEIHPSCAPDGRWVVYQHGYSLVKPTLWRVPLEGGQPVQLTDSFSMWPAVSPDGRLIAYSYFDGEQKPAQWSVGMIAFDGGAPLKRFEIAMAETRMIRWTPDGQALAYVDNRGGEINVWAQPLVAGSPQPLTNFKGEEIFSFAWSTDGKRVAYMHGNPTKDVVMINDFR